MESTRGIDWSRHIFQIVAAVVIVYVGDMLYMATLGKRRKERA